MFGLGGGAGSGLAVDERQLDPRLPRAIALEERAQYLTRALECLHNAGTGRAVGSVSQAKLFASTQRIRDKLEMANVQCSLRDALQALMDRVDPTNEVQVERLDNAIIRIKQKLFDNNAVVF